MEDVENANFGEFVDSLNTPNETLSPEGAPSSLDPMAKRLQTSDPPVIDINESAKKDGFSSQVRIPEPYVGQSWDTEAAARQYYIDYAKMAGFGIRIRTSRPGKNFRMVCSREGWVRKTSAQWEKDWGEKSSTSSLRCNCPVYISVGQSDRTKGRWVVRMVHNAHNHPCLNPISKPFLHSKTEVTETSQHFTQGFRKVGAPPAWKVARILERAENFDDRDCYNYAKRARTQLIDEGDAKGILRYCERSKRQDPEFFYSMTVDEGGRLENIFWVDSRSRLAYQQFGDVITFDTTYRTNKYRIPFAPFVGLNHHMESTFFGCSIMQDETEESFVWVFNTFIEAMNEKMPGAVITNQDIAMGNALVRVMPQSRHRLCYWHIKKKMPEKLPELYIKGSIFKFEFKRCFRDSGSPEEFDIEWCRIIHAYGLEDNTWLSSLYDVRSQWVPIYCRNTFFAGMTTTQRTENTNAFFDKFVNSGTTLFEFIKQFQEALNSRLEECRKEDFHTRYKECMLELTCPLDRHASEVYTKKVFSIFRQELRQINEYKKEKVHVEGAKVTYRVTRHMDQLNAVKDTSVRYKEVVFDKNAKTANCSCQEFEFRGILCRHILMIFTHKGIDKIPAQYILSRWTKNGNRLLDSTPIPSNARDVEMLRLHHFSRATRILQDTVKVSHEAYKLVLDGLKDLYIQASKLAYTEDDTPYDEDVPNVDTISGMETDYIGDPYVPKSKGKPKITCAGSSNARYKGGLEQARDKIRTCRGCGETGHDKRNCIEKKL